MMSLDLQWNPLGINVVKNINIIIINLKQNKKVAHHRHNKILKKAQFWYKVTLQSTLTRLISLLMAFKISRERINKSLHKIVWKTERQHYFLVNSFIYLLISNKYINFIYKLISLYLHLKNTLTSHAVYLIIHK